MRFFRQKDWGKIVGYVLIAVIILGLIYLVYWTVILGGSVREFPDIEKLKSGFPIPERAIENKQIVQICTLRFQPIS